MKIYNAIGYAIILVYALACMFFAPPHIGPWAGLSIGAAYFVVVLVHRRAVPVCGHSYGDRPSRARLQGVVRQGRHAREQHLRRLHRSGHLGEPAPAPPPVFRPSGRSEQARVRWLLANPVPLPVPLQDPGQRGERRDFQVVAVPPGRRTRCSPSPPRCSTSGLLWLLVGDLAFAAAMWIAVPGLRAVDQHDPELLDPRPALRLPALRRRARQRDEHRRVAAGHHHLQRLPAEQPPPFPGPAAPQPRRIGVRLRLPGGESHEGARAW